MAHISLLANVRLTGLNPLNIYKHDLVRRSTARSYLGTIKGMPHGSDFYNEFAKIHQIYEKSYRAMEFSTKSL